MTRERHDAGLDAVTADFAQVIAKSGLPVVAAYLFGSVARLEAGPLSDLDVAVLFDTATAPDARVAAAEIGRAHV